MSRDQRGYYYRSERVNGQPRRVYVGAGSVAALAERFDSEDRWDREAARVRQREALERYQSEDAHAERTHRQAREYLALLLRAAGYHRPGRGRWRRNRMITQVERGVPAPAGMPETPEERRRAVRRGREKTATQEEKRIAVQCLRRFPEEHARAPQAFAALAAPAWTGSGDIEGEVEIACLEGRARELAGPMASEVALLAARQVLVDQVFLQALQKRLRQDATISSKVAEAPLLDRAHRRYLASLKMLAEVQRMALPSIAVAMPGSVQVNLGEKQVNVRRG